MTPLHRKKCRGVFSHDIIDLRFEKRTRKIERNERWYYYGRMGILFVYMMIGYVACKKEYFDQEFGKKLSWLVVNVANPMLAIWAAW